MFKKYNIDELLKELDKYSFKQLHIHHTWRPNHANFRGDNHQAMQQGMKNYHTKNLGWGDIGQHLSLFPDGAWLGGRPFHSTPASIKGWNTGALAVEMIGDFDIGKDKLDGEQLRQILLLIKYFIKKYGENSIKFHREGPGVSKTCPGTSLDKSKMIKKAKELGAADMEEIDLKKFINEIGIFIDGEDKVVKTINAEGNNYVNIRDIAKVLGFDISSKGSKPAIVPKFEKIQIKNGDCHKATKIETVKLNGNTNFFKVKDLEALGLFKAEWDNENKLVKIEK